MSSILKPVQTDETTTLAQQEPLTTAAEQTDGFHLVIDALKANDVDTIYGLVGIPITDLARMAQAEGLRFIGFRHEANAVNAAAIAGYLTKKPGIAMTVSAPGFRHRGWAGRKRHGLRPLDRGR